GARYHVAIQPPPLEFGSQFSDPRSALRTFARIIKCLKAGLEHGWHSNAPRRRSNAGMRQALAPFAADAARTSVIFSLGWPQIREQINCFAGSRATHQCVSMMRPISMSD